MSRKKKDSTNINYVTNFHTRSRHTIVEFLSHYFFSLCHEESLASLHLLAEED